MTLPTGFQETVRLLSEQAKLLNELSDQLNSEITKIELRFRELNLGIEVDFPGPPSSNVILRYGKHQGIWGFLVVTGSGIYKWTEAPRQARLQTVDLFTGLFSQLLGKTQTYIQDLQEASGKLQKILGKEVDRSSDQKGKEDEKACPQSAR